MIRIVNSCQLSCKKVKGFARINPTGQVVAGERNFKMLLTDSE